MWECPTFGGDSGTNNIMERPATGRNCRAHIRKRFCCEGSPRRLSPNPIGAPSAPYSLSASRCLSTISNASLGRRSEMWPASGMRITGSSRPITQVFVWSGSQGHRRAPLRRIARARQARARSEISFGRARLLAIANGLKTPFQLASSLVIGTTITRALKRSQCPGVAKPFDAATDSASSSAGSMSER